MKVYTRAELESKSRSQLREILDSLQLSHRRSIADCVEAILGAMPQQVAQQELENYIDSQLTEDELCHHLNEQGYKDAQIGVAMQSVHPCYRSGYMRCLRDIRILPDDQPKLVTWDTDLGGWVVFPNNQKIWFVINNLRAEVKRFKIGTDVEYIKELVTTAVLNAIPQHLEDMRNDKFVSSDVRERGLTIKEIQHIHQNPGFSKLERFGEVANTELTDKIEEKEKSGNQ